VQKALTEAWRVLKRGGYIMIVTKARGAEDSETIVREDKLSGKKRYFRFQTEDEFVRLCQEAGFKVIEKKIYNEQERQKHRVLRDENWLIVIGKKISH
jgi:ubiquinone/menaquinone biosynthesis C-methylase UbiE